MGTQRFFYWLILFILLLATGLNFFLTNVFLTFLPEDYLNYPLLEIVIVLFTFSGIKNILLTIYFWRKKFWLVLVSNLITSLIYFWNIWLFYETLTDGDVTRRELMYAEKSIYWMSVITGSLYIISRSRSNFWLRIYGATIILFEVIEDLLVTTEFYLLYDFQAYLGCSIVLFLMMNFFSELNQLKRIDPEIIDN